MLSKFSIYLALLKNAIYIFSSIVYQNFTISIEHLFPFNWSLWFFFVGMAFVGLGESLESEVLDFKVLIKKNISKGKVLIIFVTKQAELLADWLTINWLKKVLLLIKCNFLWAFEVWVLVSRRNVIVSLFGGCNIKFNGFVCREMWFLRMEGSF